MIREELMRPPRRLIDVMVTRSNVSRQRMQAATDDEFKYTLSLSTALNALPPDDIGASPGGFSITDDGRRR
jgi:hypothetical protein